MISFRAKKGNALKADDINEIIDEVNSKSASQASDSSSQFSAGGSLGLASETSDTLNVGPFDIEHIEKEDSGAMTASIKDGVLYEFIFKKNNEAGESDPTTPEEPGPEEEFTVETITHEIKIDPQELHAGDSLVVSFEVDPETLSIKGTPEIEISSEGGEDGGDDGSNEGTRIKIKVAEVEAEGDWLIYKCLSPNALFWFGKLPSTKSTVEDSTVFPFKVSFIPKDESSTDPENPEEPGDGELPSHITSRVLVSANNGTVAYFEEGSEDLSVWAGEDREFDIQSTGYIFIEYTHENKSFEIKCDKTIPTQWETEEGKPIKSTVVIAYINKEEINQLTHTSFVMSPMWLGERHVMDFGLYRSMPVYS